jgi:hypothetical protein
VVARCVFSAIDNNGVIRVCTIKYQVIRIRVCHQYARLPSEANSLCAEHLTEIPLPQSNRHQILYRHIWWRYGSSVNYIENIKRHQSTDDKMYAAPANNPMTSTSEDNQECLWGGETRRDQQPTASAPPATSSSQEVQRECSTERETTEQRQQPSWRTTPPTRSLFASQDPPPVVYSTKKPRLEETSSMFRRRSTSRDRSSEEDETVQRLFQSLGHLAITDKAFELQPFTGALNSNEQPDKWVEKFQCYVAFRKINEADQLQLFKLLMRDQAADWLTSLPDHKRLDIHDLFREFQSRYELSRVAKWKQTANLWKRKQEVNESVDDYIAAMQTLAKRINMPTDLVIDAIIQGLNPEIRLHVLHTGADTIDGILQAARVSEMAHNANTTQPNQLEELATQVKLLVNKISAQTVIDTPRSPTERRVSFSQTAITAPPMRERSTSPINRPRTPDDNRGRRSFDPSTSTPPGVRPEYRRQSPRRTFDDEPYARRETSFYRNDQSSQRDTQPWRAPQSYTSTPTSNATYNHPTPYDRETSSSTFRPGYRTNSNTCRFCGSNHAMGRRFCPASNMQCFNCSKMGHMAKVCRSRPTATNSSRYNSR